MAPAPAQPVAAPSKTTPRRVAPAPRLEENIDDVTALARFTRLKKFVMFETWVIGVLGLLIFLVLPFAHPIDLFYAMNPSNQVMQMVGLDMPNMTNRAILSWSTTSITEVMTMGFGDMDIKLPKQKWRFTPKGWNAYSKAFVLQRIGETFRQSQLVLTTVPSNTPVVVAQGVNAEDTYEWVVQMPIVMTYATNNNVTKQQRGLVTLTIVRVPVEQSPSGVAIANWTIE